MRNAAFWQGTVQQTEQKMEICWPVPVFTSSSVTLTSLINKHQLKNGDGSDQINTDPGSGQNMHTDETLQSILSSADTQRKTSLALKGFFSNENERVRAMLKTL